MATTASAAAQEAVERAKSIAARLSGDTNATTTTTPAKRKRWGDAGDAATTAAAAVTEILPGLANAAKKLKDAEGSSIQKRVWVSTSKKPAAHFVAFLSERLVTLKNSATTNPDELKQIVMQLKGRGSSKEPPVPGMPEEPLHVFLQGSAAVVADLEPQIEMLIQEAEEALLLADDDDNNKTGEDGSNHTALLTDGSDYATAAATSSSSSGYKPASVAQLIGQALVPNAVKNGGGHYGPDGAGGDTVELLEEQIAVPNGVVGFVIGRGGETISSLQAKSGAKIQIQKEHEVPPGQGHRVITLIAQTKEAIDSCRTMIEAMVQDRIRSNTNSNSNGHHHHGGGGGGGNMNSNSGTTPQEQKVQEALALGHQLVQIQVPDADVGLIIGKMGSTIQSIQDRSGGASIQIPPHGDADNPTMRTVSITHPTAEGANTARQIIEDILRSKPSFAGGHSQQSQSQQGPQITVQVTIPDKDVGLCIGRQGCVIREMQHKTNTRIQIPSQPTPGLSYRIATVIGTQEGCALVENLIQRIIVEQTSACVMTGTPYNANQANGGGYGQQQGHMQQQQPYYQQQAQPQYYDGQQQQQQQQGQEYSPEWAAYYAAQTASQQQQQQMTSAAAVSTATAAAAVAGQPGADAYYDQFFRYAYYYGEEAARAYYNAWSPPVGTPNPYGQNPSGITAPPATGAETSATAAPAAAAQVAVSQPAVMNARDTSVRKVSNLPAWMTKSS